MKLFIIHRFKDKKQARILLKKVSRKMKIKFQLIFLDSIGCKTWKDQAIEAISKAEAVIVYDRKSCEESENAKWEINKAGESNLQIVDINPNDNLSIVCSKIKPLYDLEEEFGKCFKRKDGLNTLELYKLMINSSESLIQRRQKTNAFFISVIGSFLAIAGLMVKSGALHSGTIWLLYGFSVVGLLLCISWRNLIDNYGKLNKAKFDVILRLEQELDAQIFTAEWVSLGKGLRPHKYRSFTSTEKNVPLYFSWLILVLTFIAIVWQLLSKNI
ncbi:MAG TPA: hypothetical protein PLP19_12975 [bacterium]|nr:hypothetical protein [bacterium]HPN44399.1 hypothetical protein [bacterium]